MMTMDRPADTSAAHASKPMTVPEVAELFGVTTQTIYRMVKRGDLQTINRTPHVRKQAHLLFDRAYVERLARGEPPEPAEG